MGVREQGARVDERVQNEFQVLLPGEVFDRDIAIGQFFVLVVLLGDFGLLLLLPPHFLLSPGLVQDAIDGALFQVLLLLQHQLPAPLLLLKLLDLVLLRDVDITLLLRLVRRGGGQGEVKRMEGVCEKLWSSNRTAPCLAEQLVKRRFRA